MILRQPLKMSSDTATPVGACNAVSSGASRLYAGDRQRHANIGIS